MSVGPPSLRAIRRITQRVSQPYFEYASRPATGTIRSGVQPAATQKSCAIRRAVSTSAGFFEAALRLTEKNADGWAFSRWTCERTNRAAAPWCLPMCSEAPTSTAFTGVQSKTAARGDVTSMAALENPLSRNSTASRSAIRAVWPSLDA